ncbi:MAG: hypothetical protein KJO42_08300 [Silicimonas sp.]|nr:hypothetical protein [Silicimonas sp.]NND20234.1 hypothetical protein [Silicimonas sp.]NNF92714.1 hypothetical protein [Boseongicola sp.]NNL73091.1 hypothetical protein [Silicimonas sp.]RZW10218.1 MAG: hypothetical protein EX266_03705 [Paracoccaceae bacterium]
MIEALITEGLPTETRQAGKILAVGSPGEWQSDAPVTGRNGNVVFVAFGDVDRELLDHLKPDAIVSPALAWNFDCIDLAVLLEQLSYVGAYRATAMELPKPELVEAEISQLCPQLDFAIITSY